jgi:DNA-binding transcriptional LysR family regulator
MRTPHTRPRHPRPRVTLDQLHTFLAVAEREHVTAAAEALGLSQGSVSGVVRRLEATLGLPLLQRVGRNVQLTDVGRALRQLAERVLEDVGQIEELRSGYLAFERGELTVAAGRVMGAHRLSAWLAPFVAEHPEINVRLALAPMRSLVTMLTEGRADIILAGSSVRVPGVEMVVLEHTQLVTVVAAHHPLASSRTAVRDLVAHRHLAHERGSATEALAAHALGAHVDPENTLELEEGALHAALLAGLGFAAMPRSVVEQDIAAGRLVIIPLPGRGVSQSFAAARRRDLHTPAVDAFWSHLQRIAVDQA